MSKLNIALLVSGRGSVLRTVVRACREDPDLGEVVAVASNLECPALDVGREAGVAHVGAYGLAEYDSRADRDAAMAADIEQAGADFVVVGGYSEALEESLVSRFPDRIISMYPSILPAFGELDEAIGPALDLGVKLIGVTIHFRTAGTLSGGAIIAQRPLEIDRPTSVEEITERVIELEAVFLPTVLKAFADGRISRDGQHVQTS